MGRGNNSILWTTMSLGLITVLLSARCYAADDEKPLSELALEELVNVQVVTSASKTEETTPTTPGIVQVITKEDISKMGALSVAEVLNRATSIFVFGTAVIPIAPGATTSLRGDIAQSNYNPRILYLINNRPFRDSINGETVEPLLYAMPLTRISRIEILRGPGSVLWGTNAYIGVINIITQEVDSQENSVYLNYGSYNTRTGMLAGGKQFGDFKLAGGATAQATSGWDFNLIDERGVQKTIPLDAWRAGGDLSAEFHGLTFYNFVGYIHQSAVGIIPIWSTPTTYLGNLRWLSELAYATDLTDHWNGSLHITYNMNRINGYYETGSPQNDVTNISSNDLLFETIHLLTLSKALKLTLGAAAEIQSGSVTLPSRLANGSVFDVFSGPNPDPLKAVPFYRDPFFLGYAQAEYAFTDTLKLVAGGQFNKAVNLNVDFVPRIGAIWSAKTGLGAKLLYGEAYRSSTGQERNSQAPGIIYGNSSLKPETIDTFDAQVSYAQKSYDLALTYFHSKQNDVISRSFPGENFQTTVNGSLSPAGVPVTINRGEIISQGFELEGSAAPVTILRLLWGMTYEWLHEDTFTAAGTPETLHDPLGMPLTQVKLGAIVHPMERVSFSLFDNYFGNFGSISPTHSDADPTVKSFHDLSLNLDYTFNTHLKANFAAKNLLSAPIYYPEVLRHVINSVPGEPGVSFFGGITATL